MTSLGMQLASWYNLGYVVLNLLACWDLEYRISHNFPVWYSNSRSFKLKLFDMTNEQFVSTLSNGRLLHTKVNVQSLHGLKTRLKAGPPPP